MKLTAEFRKSVLAYGRPELSWKRPEDCEVEKGETVVLVSRRSSTTGNLDQAERWRDDHLRLMSGSEVLETPLVTLTITELKRTRTGGVVARYVVRDDRDEFMDAVTGRTTNRGRSIDPEAAMPERDFTDRLAREAEAHNSILREQRRRQAEVLRSEARLARNRRKGWLRTCSVR